MSSKDISASVYLGNTCEEFIKIYVYKFIGTENIKNPLRKKVSNLSLLKSWQLDWGTDELKTAKDITFTV